MKATKPRFALCLDNADYEASLIRGKVYQVLPDAKAAKDALIRVIDEDGEDYLFPDEMFVRVDFPPSVEKKLRTLAVPA